MRIQTKSSISKARAANGMGWAQKLTVGKKQASSSRWASYMRVRIKGLGLQHALGDVLHDC